ncbi:MAG: hypothetical protein RL179_294 [Planctomycetota bacterium]
MDLIPFLIFKAESGQAEFAQWRTEAGDAALALFQDRAKAEAFCKISSLSEVWVVVQPALPMLQSIFKAMIQAGIQHAVLDPDEKSARTVYKLAEVVAAAESWFSQNSNK